MPKLLTSKIKLNEGYEDKVKNFGLMDAIKKEVNYNNEPEKEYSKTSKNPAQLNYFANTASNFLSKKLHGLTLVIKANNIYDDEEKTDGDVVSRNEDYTTYLTDYSTDPNDYYYSIDDEKYEIKNGTVVIANKSEYRAIPDNLFEIIINTMEKYAGDNTGLLKVIKIISDSNTNESKQEKKPNELNEERFERFGGEYAMVIYSSQLDEFELKSYKDYNAAKRAMDFYADSEETTDDFAISHSKGKTMAYKLINLTDEKGYILIKYNIINEEFTVESFEGSSSAIATMESDFEENGGNENNGEINECTAKIYDEFMWEIIQNK